MFRQIVSVFIENKLAVVGLVIIVVMVLFCWLGPVFYHTNQTNAQEALRQIPRRICFAQRSNICSAPTTPGTTSWAA